MKRFIYQESVEVLYPMSLLENIQYLCEEHKTSVPKLENALGFGKGAIYKWEKSSPTTDKLQKVANYFKVSLDFLMLDFDREIVELVKEMSKKDKGNSYFPSLFHHILDVELTLWAESFEDLKRIPFSLNPDSIISTIKYNNFLTIKHKKELLDILNIAKIKYEDTLNRTSLSPKEDLDKANAIDTIAARLEDKDLTPKKIKLLEKYIDALFDEDNEE